MVLTDERKAILMAYCHLEEANMEPGDDLLLEREYWKAVAYLNGAGIATPEEDTARRALFDGLVDALVLDAWDNRGSQIVGYTITANERWQWEKNQLKFAEPVSNSGTGGGTSGGDTG